MAYRAGQKLGNYQLERLLGHGGFAEVYLGKHIYLHTQAAIKVLQHQLSEEALEKFLQEARIIAGLKHSHIVRVLEFGIEEQCPFLVMAYASHGTLRKRYSRGDVLSPTSILPHIKQIADALQYAHEAKIIHRDVKPDNMLLDEKDTVLLSDFGLALREHVTYQSARSTDSAGTTIYMAPEQLRGKPCAASDQYALGVVMYEWLCGCLPFDGPDISVVVQHLHEPPVPLREHVPTLPVEVEAVVLKALEKDPKQRFTSVQELAVAFEEACKDIPVPEDLAIAPLMDASGAGGSASEEWQQASLSSELVGVLSNPVQEKVLPADRATPGVSWPSHYSSLQVPSLSATLGVSTSAQDSVANATISATSSQSRTHISRRRMIAGIAGIGAIIGGVGIWRLSSGGIETLSRNVQAAQRNSGAPTSVTASNRQVPGNNKNRGTPGTGGSSAGGNSIVKDSTVNPASKSGPPGASTPSTSSSTASSSGNPAPTSTSDTSGSFSGAAPTATDTSAASQTAALTVSINNPPSSAQNGTTTYISVMTNIGTISFQFEADYSGLKNSHKNGLSAPINGITDSSGTATISWKPSLPPGQVVSGTQAQIYVVAADQNGKSVSSQLVSVAITR